MLDISVSREKLLFIKYISTYYYWYSYEILLIKTILDFCLFKLRRWSTWCSWS